MRKALSRPDALPSATIRCAIYTRKSTEEGLQQEFNSLDAQRESAEAFVKSQAQEGWVCLPDRYEDGGFTGGNLDRPAVKRLMADIDAGRIDCVVVYKVDRLSRSLLDFSKMMECFDRKKVSFVSVTQQFNTTHSMGRLTLNILLSFAQFEREIISERTRDKIAATRRKGKWAGGMPLLGYDVDPKTTKLVVNELEAAQVEQIYRLYLQLGSLMPVVEELRRRGWTNKRWTTRKGSWRGGKAFDRTSVHRLLTNVVYAGRVRYKAEVHAGEQPGIVPADLWHKVQRTLEENRRTGGAAVRNKSGAILKGLVRCAACDCAMTPSHTTKGARRYRYYTCLHAQKNGWKTCPAKSVPAAELESFVVERVRGIGRDPALVAETLRQMQAGGQARREELENEIRMLDRDLRRDAAELKAVASEAAPQDRHAAARLADLHDRLRGSEQRRSLLDDELQSIRSEWIDEAEAVETLAAFESVWAALNHREQGEVLRLLIEGIDYDGAAGKLGIRFRPAGIRNLAEQTAVKRGE